MSCQNPEVNAKIIRILDLIIYIYIYIEEFNYCMFSNAMNWGKNWVIIGMFGHQTQMLFMCLNTKNGGHE